MDDTGDEAKGTSRLGSAQRESFWVVPLVLATLAVTGVLFLNPPEGAGIATILAVPIGISGVVVAVLAIRLTNQPRMPGGEFQGRLSLAWISFVAVLSLLAILFFTLQLVRFFWPNRDSIEYLQGRAVNIGINGRLPGWSDKSGKSFEGFDAELARYLVERFKFKKVNYVLLDPGEREDALREGRVDLVIANYSITTERDKLVDFAGPYFLDKSAIFFSKAKYKGDSLNSYKVCFTAGTTSQQDVIKQYGPIVAQKSESEESLQKCMERFFYEDSAVSAIATDETILKAYQESIVRKENVSENKFSTFDYKKPEKIGVGIPNNHPGLCREISEALNDFLGEPWGAAFEKLKPYKISLDKQRPSSVDWANCGDS